MLGIWWRRLTWVGAAAGLVAGGGLAIAAVATTIARGGIGNGWIGALLAQPAAWTVPMAFAVMIAVSLATPAASRPTLGAPWSGCMLPNRSISTGVGMPDRHVALLRGINVGKAKRIAMADLRDAVGSLGHTGEDAAQQRQRRIHRCR